ncbi:uncharacterized protein BDZ99DRAFT_146103 [Mytilinidion resinicola]|uniref:Uncharacterized protein n=1 Tax=Mytilinidion resinicola TaxID=574789 RepID=A0A6A6Y8Q1_9PEZI|nr:uncharacterized protein BDZ99DRAFT_146103 [Mytilinidion resinicola]KAF2804943.1 hypothetical protein BDZ99DRAFT_146103 [Mytilinidion resinicola]
MHSLKKQAILWLPTVAFFTTALYRVLALYLHSPLGRVYRRFTESPTLSLWIPILLLQIYTLLQCGNQPAKLEAAMFWSLLLTPLAIRCLTLLLALCSSEPYDDAMWPLVPIFSNSPGKPAAISIICDWLLWDRVYLGRYQDYCYDEASRSVTDVDGAVLHRFKPDQNPIYFPWRDLTVRLGYIHVIDNFLHVIWLRYFYADGPYTAHINNSELFTVLLVVQVAVYSYARRCTCVKLHDDVEAGGADDEKGDV